MVPALAVFVGMHIAHVCDRHLINKCMQLQSTSYSKLEIMNNEQTTQNSFVCIHQAAQNLHDQIVLAWVWMPFNRQTFAKNLLMGLKPMRQLNRMTISAKCRFICLVVFGMTDGFPWMGHIHEWNDNDIELEKNVTFF